MYDFPQCFAFYTSSLTANVMDCSSGNLGYFLAPSPSPMRTSYREAPYPFSASQPAAQPLISPAKFTQPFIVSLIASKRRRKSLPSERAPRRPRPAAVLRVWPLGCVKSRQDLPQPPTRVSATCHLTDRPTCVANCEPNPSLSLSLSLSLGGAV